MLDTLKNLGAGYRTYIIAGLYLIMVFAEKALELDIPGFSVGDDWLSHVLGAMGLGTLRASIGK